MEAKLLSVSEYYKKAGALYVSGKTEREIDRITGLKSKFLFKKLPIKNNKIKRDAARAINNPNLGFTGKAVLVMEYAIQDAMITLLNLNYVASKKTGYKGMQFLWRAASKPHKFAFLESSVQVTFTGKMKVPYDRFEVTLEYRNPAFGYLAYGQFGGKGTGAFPQKGRKRTGSVDPIHIGASILFERFAITSVKLFGKQIKAGRRGTDLEGLGLEPINVKPKASASRKDYIAFKRRGYPGRENPDRLSGTLGKYPIFVNLLLNKKAQRYIFVQVKKTVAAFVESWNASREKIINEVANETNQKTSK